MEGAAIGPYRVLRGLGRGGMGTVYLARVVGRVPDLEEGLEVALKVIHPHLLETPGFFKRFLREAELGRSIQHPNVVRTFDCDSLVVDGVRHDFLVMEYVEGHTLRDLLAELERVPEELCRHVGREVAKGLAAIHEAGVLHRDLKPENVLITREHEVKIMDLGVARLQEETVRLSQTGAFVGSLEYAAPEQFQTADGEPDGRADLHALGVLLYELATGHHPFRDEDASRVLRNVLERTPRKAGELNPQLSPFFEEVVHTLLAKDARERFADATELVRVLEEGEHGAWWREQADALRAATKAPLRRVRIPRETALYGRDEELERLRALYEEAKRGHGRVVLIEGEAGIGKTRLVDEFVSRLREEGEELHFLFGSYPPGGAATAVGAFSSAYREHFGAEGLEARLEDYLPSAPLLIPAFAAVLRGALVPEGERTLTRDSLQTLFVHVTRALAAERPTIVLIDDLHFAPEEGRGIFSSLAMAAPDHRLLLVGTQRSGVPTAWTADVTRLDHAELRSLPRLGPKDLGNLLRDAFRSERLADELGWRIAEKSDGNPFFAFEIIRGLREGHLIERSADGVWVTTQAIRNIEVPSSVLELVQARIAYLDPDEKNVLDVAACCGFAFDPVLAGAVLGWDQIPTMQRLARIEKRHQLVRSAGRHFVFDHHQVQEALYEGLPELLREPYHAAIGEALERREHATEADPGELDGALCVDLCGHFLKGARGERALRYLNPAMRYLGESYLHHDAIALADRALAVPDLLEGERRLQVLKSKWARLDLLGRRDEQAEVGQEAEALAAELGPAAEAAMARGRGLLCVRTGDLAAAEEPLRRALEVFRDVGDREEEAATLNVLGMAYQGQGRFAEARAMYEGYLAWARATGDRVSESKALGNLGILEQYEARFPEAKALFQRSWDLAWEGDDDDWKAATSINLGLVLALLGELEAARAHFEKGRALAVACGNRQWEANALGNLAIVASREGRLEEEEELCRNLLALMQEIGSRSGVAKAWTSLGNLQERKGNLAEAVEAYKRSVRDAKAIGDRRSLAIASLNLGTTWRRLGQGDRARQALETTLETSRAIGAEDAEALALLGLAAVADEEGATDRAITLAEEGVVLRRKTGPDKAIREALTTLAEVRARSGDVRTARSLLEEAVSLASSNPQGDPPKARVLLATLPGSDADPDLPGPDGLEPLPLNAPLHLLLWKATGNLEHLRRAKRHLDALVAHAPEDCHASMRQRVHAHREIEEAWAAHGDDA